MGTNNLALKVMSSIDYKFKIVVVGDSGVGKTAFLDCLDWSYIEGFACKIETLVVENKTMKIQLWDTSGLERFRALLPGYYRGAHGFLLLFDASNSKSFDNISYWNNHVLKSANEGVQKIVVGNKSDKTDKVVAFERAKSLAESIGASYMEASVFDKRSVEEICRCLVGETVKIRMKGKRSDRC